MTETNKQRPFNLSEHINRLLARNPLFLDTETTGLGTDAQIIEIAITDKTGRLIFGCMIKPTIDIEPGEENVHGISMDVLEGCQNFNEVSVNIEMILRDRPVLIFNSGFDMRLLRQSINVWGGHTEWIDDIEDHCVMEMAVNRFGSTNRYNSISLSNAMKKANIEWRGQAHTARGDCMATADLVHELAKGK